MEGKAPRVNSFSKTAKRKWKESDKTVGSLEAAIIREVCLYFCLFFSGGCLLLIPSIFSGRGKESSCK